MLARADPQDWGALAPGTGAVAAGRLTHESPTRMGSPDSMRMPRQKPSTWRSARFAPCCESTVSGPTSSPTWRCCRSGTTSAWLCRQTTRRSYSKHAGDSRSRSLPPAVTLALNTGMHYSEIRLLQCWQVDLIARRIKVGVSKTEAGAGRSIPLNDRATAVLKFWLSTFPDRTWDDFLFPSERYGVAGNDRTPCVYDIDTRRPIKSWKEAWESAKRKAGVRCRFHDLRHTCTTRMLERGVPLAVVASVLGWSTATTVRMVKRYGEIGS